MIRSCPRLTSALATASVLVCVTFGAAARPQVPAEPSSGVRSLTPRTAAEIEARREALEAERSSTAEALGSPRLDLLNRRHPEIHAYLQTTERQRQEIDEALAAARAGIAESLTRDISYLESLKSPEDGWEARLEEGRGQRDGLREDAEEEVFSDVLTDAQVEVLKRIHWSGQGIKALLDDELADRLKMPRIQRRLVRASIARRDELIRQMHVETITQTSKTGPDRAEGFRLIQERAGETEVAILSMLYPSQREKFREILESVRHLDRGRDRP